MYTAMYTNFIFYSYILFVTVFSVHAFCNFSFIHNTISTISSITLKKLFHVYKMKFKITTTIKNRQCLIFSNLYPTSVKI